MAMKLLICYTTCITKEIYPILVNFGHFYIVNFQKILRRKL